MTYTQQQRLLTIILGLERGDLSRTTAAADLRRLLMPAKVAKPDPEDDYADRAEWKAHR